MSVCLYVCCNLHPLEIKLCETRNMKTVHSLDTDTHIDVIRLILHGAPYHTHTCYYIFIRALENLASPANKSHIHTHTHTHIHTQNTHIHKHISFIEYALMYTLTFIITHSCLHTHTHALNTHTPHTCYEFAFIVR